VQVKVTAPASNGGSPITGYHVVITGTKGSRTLTLGAGGGTVTIDGLTARTGYRIAVTARNAVGASSPRTARTTTTAEPAPTPIPRLGNGVLVPGQSAVLSGDGLFPLNSSNLTASGRSQLATLARALRSAKAIRCDGYTDISTTPVASYRLGLARAKRVCATLASFGVHATPSVRSFGNSRPVVLHGTWRDRAPNRRVVVFVSR
jgi:outer membrane protein OmpA-like peptidoglycan-associated protein